MKAPFRNAFGESEHQMIQQFLTYYQESKQDSRSIQITEGYRPDQS